MKKVNKNKTKRLYAVASYFKNNGGIIGSSSAYSADEALEYHFDMIFALNRGYILSDIEVFDEGPCNSKNKKRLEIEKGSKKAYDYIKKLKKRDAKEVKKLIKEKGLKFYYIVSWDLFKESVYSDIICCNDRPLLNFVRCNFLIMDRLTDIKAFELKSMKDEKDFELAKDPKNCKEVNDYANSLFEKYGYKSKE